MRVDDVWREIRALRSAPPGLADEPERRAVFGAALQQSQELMAAAEQVGFASKPLPLFYSLSQAGRAITAARMAGSTWEIRGHGLRIGLAGDDVSLATVTPTPFEDGSDAYGLVSAATGSEVLATRVTLAQVWASMPDVSPHRAIGRSERQAFEVEFSWTGNEPLSGRPSRSLDASVHDRSRVIACRSGGVHGGLCADRRLGDRGGLG